MRRFFLTILSIGALAAPARAEDAKLTVGKCVQMFNALSGLREYPKFSKDEKGDKTTSVPYRFGGAVRFSIAQTITALRPFAESTDRTRLDLIQEAGQGKPPNEMTPGELAKLNAEYSKILDQPCGVTVSKIRLSDLKLGDDDGQNPIPPDTLSLIMPMIEVDK
jgi:hypothetical protein